MDEPSTVGVLGASSFVGECVIQRLRKDGRQIVAFFMSAHAGKTDSNVTLFQLSPAIAASHEVPPI